MDHRWDASTWSDRASRAERERFGTSRVARDPEVERRDRLREEERRRAFNQSPWEIGALYYDQRDLYTRNASMAEDGYGVGPRSHPEEGSYAYPREAEPARILAYEEGEATIEEREAWPWLNYDSRREDPYFEHPHAHEAYEGARTLWRRLACRLKGAFQPGGPPCTPEDERLARDVRCALAFRGDLDTTDIEVRARAGEITLEGTVPDRRSKLLAKETSEGVHDVLAVDDRLTIRPDDPRDGALIRPLGLMWG